MDHKISVVRMWEGGIAAEDIAAAFGRTKRAIEGLMQRMQVPRSEEFIFLAKRTAAKKSGKGRFRFYYLSVPYETYVGGIFAAQDAASKAAAELIRAGIPVFCAVTHNHAIALNGGIDALNNDIWIKANDPFLCAARGLIVLTARHWQRCERVNAEISVIGEKQRPIVLWEPGTPIPKEIAL